MKPNRLNLISPTVIACAILLFLLSGCSRIPGKPHPGPDVTRPDQVLDFTTLYRHNCAACHGDNGKNGASTPLANPVYLAFAGEQNLHQTIAKGVAGQLMPPFAASAGGMLTDQQVDALTKGILQTWGASNTLAGQNFPPYAATLSGDPERGQQAYAIACARCHGVNGEGSARAKSDPARLGSIVDPSYLALISDQNLRSIVVAGMAGMPDWRSDSTQPLTDQQITDIVAWLASHRIATPGQPYPTHP